MMKEEFEKRIGKTVSTDEYRKFEYVYMFHPLLEDVGGKDQIASLYLIGGMRLINDMMPTAEKAEILSGQIQETRATLDRLTNKYNALKQGEDEEEE